MKFETSAALFVLLGVASARPDAVRRVPRATTNSAKFRREVPQEHSHEKFVTSVTTSLNLNNVDKVQDAVFGLLGDKAAITGAGLVTNPDCLQQRSADQAFTNAKAAGDVAAQADALIYRALERNTGSVGLASVLCNETATNPEIAAIQQHQDPASSGAAALNKQITLALATQLASIGADPTLALQSGTFAPGNIGDTTGKGNSCDDITTNGCIFDSNLLVEDATAAEIKAAVASGSTAVASGSTAVASGSTAVASGSAAAANETAAATDDAGSSAADTATPTTAGTNVNTFTGAVGSAPVPVISSSGDRPFSVNGATFVNEGAAIQRACSVQNNACSNAANSGGGGSVAACNAQEDACNAAAATKRRRATGTNVNTFTGSVGSAPVPVISSTGDRPFSVNGDTFVNEGAAIQRACSVQNTACSNAANSGKGGSVAACNAQEDACNAAAKRRRAALDTGSCGSPAIEFAAGLDGRTESSFAPVNTADFNHGSALKPAVVTGFICQQLASKCKAAQATIDACNKGVTAANAATGQAAADAFNSALGV